MKLTFKQALSANLISTILGIGTQALTAPLYLIFIPVNEYAVWVFVNSVSAYVSLAALGFFYSAMNMIAISSIQGTNKQSVSVYNAAMTLIGVLYLMCAVVFISTISLLGILFSILSLTHVMIDANFRSMNRYRFGTNFLAGVRTIDWVVSLIFLWAVRDIKMVIALNAIYKSISVILLLKIMSHFDGHLPLKPSFRDARRIADIVMNSGPQLILSLTTAAAVMGPQIVVSSIFDSATSVIFNTTRTYLRLTSAMVTVFTNASWPLISEMFARHDRQGLQYFLQRLTTRSFAAAAVFGTLLIVLSGPAFSVLFNGKIASNHLYMCIMLGSVLANCIITVQQSFFLSSNASHVGLIQALVATLATLLVMAFVGSYFGFTPCIVIEGALDFATLALMYRTTAFALTNLPGPADGRAASVN